MSETNADDQKFIREMNRTTPNKIPESLEEAAEKHADEVLNGVQSGPIIVDRKDITNCFYSGAEYERARILRLLRSDEARWSCVEDGKWEIDKSEDTEEVMSAWCYPAMTWADWLEGKLK